LSESKRYIVSGEIMKPNFFAPMKFRKEITATKQAQAIERIYTDMGSKHRAKRYEIRILDVQEADASSETDKKVE